MFVTVQQFIFIIHDKFCLSPAMNVTYLRITKNT